MIHNSNIEDAFGAIADHIGRGKVKVVWTGEGAVPCADIPNRIIRIPRMASVSDLSNTGLVMLRGNVYHEALHIDMTNGTKPAGVLGEIANALEDIRIEHGGAMKHAGAHSALYDSNLICEKKLAEKFAQNPGAAQPLRDALLRLMFEAQSIRPTWELNPKTSDYISKIRELFFKIFDCQNFDEVLSLAKKIYEKLQEDIKKDREEQKQKNQEKQQQKKGKKEKPESQEKDEQDQSTGGESDEQEGEGDQDEQDDAGGAETDKEGEEDAESDKKDGKGGDNADEDSTDEAGEGEESEQGEDDGDGKSGKGDEESDEEEEGQGKGNPSDEGEESNEDGQDNSTGQTSATDGDENDVDDNSSDTPSNDSTPSKPEQTEEEKNAEAQKQIEKDLEGDSKESIQEEILSNEISKATGYTADRSQDTFTTPEITQSLRDAYLEHRKNASSTITSLTYAFANALRALAMSHKNSNQRKGKLDDNALWKIAADGIDCSKVFYKIMPGEKINTAVAILLDQSGSMKCRMEKVVDVSMCMAEALHAVKIPFHVMGHNVKSQNRRRAIGFDRTDSVNMYVYKTWNESWMNVGARIKSAGNYCYENDTNLDISAIDYSIQALAQRQEVRKVLLVISDGAPTAGGQICKAALKPRIEELRRLGFEIYNLSLDTALPHVYYGTEHCIDLRTNSPTFGKDFATAISQIIMKGKFRI